MNFNVDESLILITTPKYSSNYLISLKSVKYFQHCSSPCLWSLSAGLPVLLVFIQSPHELLLVVSLLPRHVVPAGDHLVAHHLQPVEDLPGGDTELDPLLLLTVVLGLLLHLLRDGPHLVMVEALHCHPPLTDALSGGGEGGMVDQNTNNKTTNLTKTYGIARLLQPTQSGLE